MTTTPYKRPRQARSLATLERLGDAARQQLRDQHWDDIKVDGMCKAARSSVGAFYARFPNKQGLLTYLAEQAETEYGAVVTWYCNDVKQRKLPLSSRLRQLVAALWRYTDRHAGVLRALIDKRQALPLNNAALAARLEATLPHVPGRGVAIVVLLDALRARLIKDTPPGQPRMEVAELMAAYLEFKAASGSPHND